MQGIASEAPSNQPAQNLCWMVENMLSTKHEHAESKPLLSGRKGRPLGLASVQRKRAASFSLADKADREEHCNRGVTNQDAGGLNVLIDYIPTGSDPKSINFLQAFEVITPVLNGGKPIIAMDNGTAGAVPYYNATGASGTDSNDTSGVPLDASNVEAWMLDIPYVCESGFSGTGMGCPAPTMANDETITSYEDAFDTFIEAPGTYMGTTYEVLYCGFRWGFTFTANDVPEPSTWAMMILSFLGLSYAGNRVRKSGSIAARPPAATHAGWARWRRLTIRAQ